MMCSQSPVTTVTIHEIVLNIGARREPKGICGAAAGNFTNWHQGQCQRHRLTLYAVTISVDDAKRKGPRCLGRCIDLIRVPRWFIVLEKRSTELVLDKETAHRAVLETSADNSVAGSHVGSLCQGIFWWLGLSVLSLKHNRMVLFRQASN